MRRTAATIAAALGALIFLVLVLETYYTVDQGERAVILHYGALAGVSEPGLHFKLPLVTTVEKISIQPQVAFYGQDRDSPFQSYSRDQQPANFQVSVNYHVTDVEAVYANFGSIETLRTRIIDPKVFEEVKNVFGQFDAADAIQKRAILNAQVFNALKSAVRGPIVVDSVQIQDIQFSQQYESAVEARMQAIVKQQQAEADKAKRFIDADAAAYEVTAQAKATAFSKQAVGEAEAAAIRARGDALKANPELPSLVAAEKWNGVLPTQMVPGNSVPFLQLNPR